MQSMVISSEIDFFKNITNEIFATLGDRSARLKIPDYEGASKPSLEFLDFMKSLSSSHPNKSPVILIDEYELMEDKVDEGRLTKDVFDAFAHLMEHHRMFFVFTGSEFLDERGHHVWKILARSSYKRISYLERTDAEGLITGPVEGRVDYADGSVERIYRLAAGQPFYTQWVCQNVVDHLNEQRTKVVDDDALKSVIKTLVQNPAPEMTRLWKDLPTDEKITLSLLAEVLEDSDGYAHPDALAAYAKKKLSDRREPGADRECCGGVEPEGAARQAEGRGAGRRGLPVHDGPVADLDPSQPRGLAGHPRGGDPGSSVASAPSRAADRRCCGPTPAPRCSGQHHRLPEYSPLLLLSATRVRECDGPRPLPKPQ